MSEADGSSRTRYRTWRPRPVSAPCRHARSSWSRLIAWRWDLGGRSPSHTAGNTHHSRRTGDPGDHPAAELVRATAPVCGPARSTSRAASRAAPPAAAACGFDGNSRRRHRTSPLLRGASTPSEAWPRLRSAGIACLFSPDGRSPSGAERRSRRNLRRVAREAGAGTRRSTPGGLGREPSPLLGSARSSGRLRLVGSHASPTQFRTDGLFWRPPSRPTSARLDR